MTKFNYSDSASPTRSVLIWAFLFSAACYIGGMIIFLGSILSIFVTVPIGALIGALWGVINWTEVRANPGVHQVFKWIIGIWIATLLYVHFIFTKGFTSWVEASAVWLQVVLLVGTAFLLLNGKVRTRLTSTSRGCSIIILATLVLLILMTVFPPVTRPWWVPDHQQISAPLPMVSFFLDPGFDANHHYPRFAINDRVLLLEWLAMITFASATCGLIVLTKRVSRK